MIVSFWKNSVVEIASGREEEVVEGSNGLRHTATRSLSTCRVATSSWKVVLIVDPSRELRTDRLGSCKHPNAELPTKVFMRVGGTSSMRTDNQMETINLVSSKMQ